MPKPPPKPPILLQQRLPFQGQTWTDLGGVWEHGAAQDALSLPDPRPLPGTLLRAVERRSVTWAGVADGGGRMLPLPPLRLVRHRPERGVSTWFQAWDGPRAKYDWMLEAAGRIDRTLHVSVALAALALVTPRLGPDEFERAVAELRAWLRGEGSEERVESAAETLTELDRSPRYGRAEEAARAACRIVTEPVASVWTRDVVNTVTWIFGRPDGQTESDVPAWNAARLVQVENIRQNIPLGLVILSYVEDDRAKLERRATVRSYSRLG